MKDNRNNMDGAEIFKNHTSNTLGHHINPKCHPRHFLSELG